jgi:hypothetical protein
LDYYNNVYEKIMKNGRLWLLLKEKMNGGKKL